MPTNAKEESRLPLEDLGIDVPTRTLIEFGGLEALGHKPLVVLYDMSFSRTTAHLNPSFILYEDGMVLFRQKKNGGFKTYKSFLSRNSIYELQEQIISDGFMREEDGFLALPRSIYCTSSCFPPAPVRILVRVGNRWKGVSVTGFENCSSYNYEISAFFEVKRGLENFDADNKVPWPEEIEVSLVYRGNQKKCKLDSCLKCMNWPKELPPIPKNAESPDTGILQFSVPGLHEVMLHEIRNNHRPVIYSGYTWSIELQYSIPEEAYLRRLVKTVWPNRF